MPRNEFSGTFVPLAGAESSNNFTRTFLLLMKIFKEILQRHVYQPVVIVPEGHTRDLTFLVFQCLHVSGRSWATTTSKWKAMQKDALNEEESARACRLSSAVHPHASLSGMSCQLCQTWRNFERKWISMHFGMSRDWRNLLCRSSVVFRNHDLGATRVWIRKVADTVSCVPTQTSFHYIYAAWEPLKDVSPNLQCRKNNAITFSSTHYDAKDPST